MKTTTLCIIIILSLMHFLNINAQVINKADSSQKVYDMRILEERINKADLVVEGKVIKQKAFWNKKYTSIYTSNTLIVYKLFKGQLLNDTIEVVTIGGFLTDSDTLANVARGLIVSHNHQLSGSQEGIFFLRVNNIDVQMRKSPNSFVMWDQYQIVYDYNHFYPPARFGSLWFQDVSKEVYPIICNTLGKQYTVLSANPRDKVIQK